MLPSNLDLFTPEILFSQTIPESLASASLDHGLEHLYELILETPSDTQSTQEITPNFPPFDFQDPLSLPPQIPAPVDDIANFRDIRSSSASLPPATPPSQVKALPPSNWHEIPQNAYDYGRKQWDFTPSEDISFSVNGCPGINMGDALQKRFAGLDGRDELVLQDASSVISCRLSVGLS